MLVEAATASCRVREPRARNIKPDAPALIKWVLMGALCLASTARAENLSTATTRLPAGHFTTAEHSDEWKIKNALSAGPASITNHAAVMDWPKSGAHEGGRVLREGTNGWTCMPDTPGRPQHNPMCVDATTMKWMKATFAGERPNIDRIGLSYMLMGEARQGQNAPKAKDPSQVKEWFYIGPHVMIVLPDAAANALRDINQDLSSNEPYTTFLSSAPGATPILVIPVAKSGNRLVEVPAK